MNLSEKWLIADVFDVYALNNANEVIMSEEDNSDVSFSLKTDVKEY